LHALINELAIGCGYSSASVSERIYSRRPGEGLDPMAGVLLYTSASDAEGTLGGLVNLGKPGELGPSWPERLNVPASAAATHCALTINPTRSTGRSRRFVPRIPARGLDQLNRYLDRSTLVDTFAHTGLEFFGEQAG
jgi:hypothetical protein